MTPFENRVFYVVKTVYMTTEPALIQNFLNGLLIKNTQNVNPTNVEYISKVYCLKEIPKPP